MNAVCSQRGVTITTAMLARYKTELSCKSTKTKIDNYIPSPIAGYVIVPRAFALGRPEIHARVFQAVVTRELGEFSRTLLDYQTIVRSHVLDRYARANEGMGTYLLNMRAGAGKTTLAAGIAASLGQRVIWIVPNRNILEQTIPEIQRCLPSANIKHIGTADELGDIDIAIMIIHSAVKKEPEFFKQFGFSVLDEVHTYCTAAHGKIFWLVQCRFAFAMSATTDKRTDQMDVIAWQHYGKPVYASELCPSLKNPTSFKCKSRIIQYTSNTTYMEDKYLLTCVCISECGCHAECRCQPDCTCDTRRVSPYNYSKALTDLCRDERRNDMIKQLVVKYVARGRNIIVLGDRIEQLEAIALDPIGILTGRDEAKQANAREQQVIYSTLGFSGAGLNIQRLDTMIIASPRKNGCEQIFARILRTGSDIRIARKFIDVNDPGTLFGGEVVGRLGEYWRLGARLKVTGTIPMNITNFQWLDESLREFDGKAKGYPHLGPRLIGDMTYTDKMRLLELVTRLADRMKQYPHLREYPNAQLLLREIVGLCK